MHCHINICIKFLKKCNRGKFSIEWNLMPCLHCSKAEKHKKYGQLIKHIKVFGITFLLAMFKTLHINSIIL